ncbi:MAG: Hpt domain-containing protein [Hellea sp.]|nr:Hpt domain-containing protein [Hellea sp.]
MSTENTHIDFDHLRQYVGDDPAMTAEIFGLFKNQVDLWSPSLVSDLDDDAWAMMTHSIKGTARAIGAFELADLCEQAELLIGEGKRPGAREVSVEKIDNEIDKIMIEIQRWEYRQTISKMKSETF